MKRSKIVLTACLFLLLPLAAGVEASVSTSCSPDEEAMVSLSNTDGGHIAQPGEFNDKVCVSGVEYLDIKNSCGNDEQFVFSMTNRTDAHFSILENEYNYQVCSSRTTGHVEAGDTCGTNSTAVMEVSARNDSHAASLANDNYNKVFCLGGTSAENVTLKLQSPKIGDSVYVDETTISSENSMNPPFAFPYIIAENPVAGIVSAGGVTEIARPSSDEVEITQNIGNTYMVPFTTGSYREVEDEEDDVTNDRFLSGLSPNFAFADVSTPTVKVIHDSSRKVEGFSNTIYQGRVEFTVQNKYVGDGKPTTIKITPE